VRNDADFVGKLFADSHRITTVQLMSQTTASKVMPIPSEILPSGAIVIDDERAAMLNGFPEGLSNPDFSSRRSTMTKHILDSSCSGCENQQTTT